MRKSIIESTVVVWINFGKAVGTLQAGMASCVHESLWTQHELQQYENDGELKPWERWSKKVHRVSSWSSQKPWLTEPLMSWVQCFGRAEALLKHCNLDGKDDKMPLVQWKLLEQQHVILPQEIPRLSFWEYGLFLSLTFFADAPNICTRNSIINTKRDNTWSVFQWWAKKQAFE